MSFIAVTYGYNQYSIFNTNTPTQPLIDTIISTCLNIINVSIEDRIHVLTNELKQLQVDMESLRKTIADRQKEEESAIKMSPMKGGKQSNTILSR